MKFTKSDGKITETLGFPKAWIILYLKANINGNFNLKAKEAWENVNISSTNTINF